MKTNFFQNIAELNVPGIWKISIQNDASGSFVVSALYAPVQSTDPATKMIAPLILKGTVAEIDEGFFDTIEKPIQATAGFYNNVEAYNKNLKNAEKKLSGGKSGAVKNEKSNDIEVSEPKPSAEERRKTYTDAIRNVVELNDACKYEEALNLLPSVNDYPEKAEELEKRKADLSRKKEQMAKAMELFNKD